MGEGGKKECEREGKREPLQTGKKVTCRGYVGLEKREGLVDRKLGCVPARMLRQVGTS